MIVYPPGNVHSNVAAGKTVTASGVGYNGSLTGLVDGDIRGASAASGGPCPACGYFHSATNYDNWVMVDFGEEIAIGGIFLYQTEDMGGFSRALGLYVEILDASQNTVLTTAPVQDSRAGYLLDFSPTRPIYQRGGIMIGQSHMCAFMNDGSVQCWRNNDYGKLGDGTTDASLNPVAVQGITNALFVESRAATHHQCALLTDRSVKCWGAFAIGDDTWDANSTFAKEPTAVQGITNAVAISVSDDFNCVIQDGSHFDGSVWCWGSNLYGQLGDGTAGVISGSAAGPRKTPVQVSGISNVKSVSAGYSHTCALLQDGSAKCWGWNNKGQLGDGSDVEYNTAPSLVLGVTNATSIASGYWHVCALLGGGNVTCWGNNQYGQLGNGATGDKSAAVQVLNITSARTIALGHHHSCALLRSGVIKCWGRNANGQLGDGAFDDRSSPVEVLGITDAISVAAGYAVSCAVLASEEARCWGNNEYGQLGDGSTTGSSIPVSTTYTNQWRGLDHVYEVGDTLDGWKHFVDGFTYDFTVNVENYASIGPAIYSVSLDGVLPIEDQFTIHVTPDRTAGQIGFIDNDNLTNYYKWHSASSTTGTKLFSITSKTSISRIEITYARPIYAPGWLIQENGVEIFREISNRGDSPDPEPVMYSYDRPCDTSAAPENGGVGDCPSSLPSGSTCQPTCDEGYTVSGLSSCSLGTLTTATCDPAPCDTSEIGPPHCSSLFVNMVADDYPGEIVWNVVGPSGRDVPGGEGGSSPKTVTLCEGGDHQFVNEDTYGDGICCEYGIGYYSLHLDGVLVYYSDGQYDAGETVDFNVEAPENGGVGDCPSSLQSGSTCQPTCNSGYTVSGTSSCSFGTLTAATCSANPCNASAAPTNGAAGDCTNSLASGSTCQPTCDKGYIVSGLSSCSLGTLTTATCRELTCCENTFVKFGFGVQHTYEEL